MSEEIHIFATKFKMKKVLYLSAVAVAVLAACQKGDKQELEEVAPVPENPSVTPETKQPAPIVLSVSEQGVASAANSFGLKVFSILSSGEQAQDLLFSPLIGIDGGNAGGHEGTERTVVANRPFVFALVESSSRSILFLGRKCL